MLDLLNEFCMAYLIVGLLLAVCIMTITNYKSVQPAMTFVILVFISPVFLVYYSVVELRRKRDKLP